jgi:hypothetical protein
VTDAQALYALPDLSSLSDAELFALRESRDAAPFHDARDDLRRLDALAAGLGPRELFSVARVTLLRSYLLEAARREDAAIRVLTEYLARVEPFHPKLNMVAYLPFAVPMYARLGDLLLAAGRSSAADAYLRILGLGMLRRTTPFVMLVASSRIVRGASLRFEETGDAKQVRNAQYGSALFRFAIECAYDSTATDFEAHAVGPDRLELPRSHFFREIAREAAVLAEAMERLNERLAEGNGRPQGS